MGEKEIVRAIEEYFKQHPDLGWSFGKMVLNGHDTIKMMKKDKAFRKTLVEAVVKYSIEQLVKGDVNNGGV